MKKNFYIFISSLFCLVFLNCIGQTNENLKVDEAAMKSDSVETVHNMESSVNTTQDDSLIVAPLEENVNIDFQYLYEQDGGIYVFKNGKTNKVYSLEENEYIKFSKNKKFAFSHLRNSTDWKTDTTYRLQLISSLGEVNHFDTPEILFGDESMGSFIPFDDGTGAIQVLIDPLSNSSAFKNYRIQEGRLELIYSFNYPNSIVDYNYDIASNTIYFAYLKGGGTFVEAYSLDGKFQWRYFLNNSMPLYDGLQVNSNRSMISLLVSDIKKRGSHKTVIIENGALTHTFPPLITKFIHDGERNELIGVGMNKLIVFDLNKNTLFLDSIQLDSNEWQDALIMDVISTDSSIVLSVYYHEPYSKISKSDIFKPYSEIITLSRVGQKQKKIKINEADFIPLYLIDGKSIFIKNDNQPIYIKDEK